MNELKRLLNSSITLDDLINDYYESMSAVIKSPSSHVEIVEEIIQEKNDSKILLNAEKIMDLLQELPGINAREVLYRLKPEVRNSEVWKAVVGKQIVVNNRKVFKYAKLMRNLSSIPK